MNSRIVNITEHPDYYEMSYTKKLVSAEMPHRDPNLEVQINSFKADDTTASFKIRKEDLDKAGWSITKSTGEAQTKFTMAPQLEKYINDGLKILLGFDFDLTLTNKHTWNGTTKPSLATLTPENLKGGEYTKATLSQYAKQENLIMFVATNNYLTVAQAHLNIFGIDEFFPIIKSRDDFHTSGGDKDVCFRQVYDEKLKTESALDEEGFLNLNAPGKIIDVVVADLVDDDNKADHIDKFFTSRGITYLSVSKAENNVDHYHFISKSYIAKIQPLSENKEQNNNFTPTVAQHHATTFSQTKLPEESNKQDDTKSALKRKGPTLRRSSDDDDSGISLAD